MARLQPKILPMTARDKRAHRPRPRYQPLLSPPASLGRAIATTSGQILAGLVIGQLGVIAWDWAKAGPGAFAVFGL